MGLGILIQMFMVLRDVVKDPDKFEYDAARLVNTAREFRKRLGRD